MYLYQSWVCGPALRQRLSISGTCSTLVESTLICVRLKMKRLPVKVCPVLKEEKGADLPILGNFGWPRE